MATQALYRQWRPETFHDMVGQEAVVTTLRHQIQTGRISHAYLFCGSRGTGKTSAAKVLARAVNCLAPVDGDACGHCDACIQLQRENNMDIIEIDAASNNGVDEIRDLREKIHYPPSISKYRVYIIDEVHMLTTGAFNALLKTLEEPPEHAIFILATTEPQRLPPTVLSRCQRFDFKRFTHAQIVGRLAQAANAENAQTEPAALAKIARAAEGGMRDALGILDVCLSFGAGTVTASVVNSVLGISDETFLFSWLDHIRTGNAAAALEGVEQALRQQEPTTFARDVTTHLRALLIAFSCENAADVLDTTAEQADAYRAQSQALGLDAVLRLIDLFVQMESEIRWVSHPRTILDATVVRACRPQDDSGIEALAQRLMQIEAQIESGALAAPPAPAKPRTKPAASAPSLTASKPAPAPDGDLAATWKQVLTAVKKEKIAHYQHLKTTQVHMEGDVLHILFKPNQGHMGVVDTDAGRELIRRLLEERGVAVGGIVFRLESDNAAPDPAPAAEPDDTLSNLIAWAGRDKVQIVTEDPE